VWGAPIPVPQTETQNFNKMEQFPPPAANQKYATVHTLSSDFLTLPEELFVHPSTPGARNTVPSRSFLIQHPLHFYGQTHPDPLRCRDPQKLQSLPFSITRAVGEQEAVGKQEAVGDHGIGLSDSLRNGGLEQKDMDMLNGVHVDDKPLKLELVESVARERKDSFQT